MLRLGKPEAAIPTNTQFSPRWKRGQKRRPRRRTTAARAHINAVAGSTAGRLRPRGAWKATPPPTTVAAPSVLSALLLPTLSLPPPGLRRPGCCRHCHLVARGPSNRRLRKRRLRSTPRVHREAELRRLPPLRLRRRRHRAPQPPHRPLKLAGSLAPRLAQKDTCPAS